LAPSQGRRECDAQTWRCRRDQAGAIDRNLELPAFSSSAWEIGRFVPRPMQHHTYAAYPTAQMCDRIEKSFFDLLRKCLKLTATIRHQQDQMERCPGDDTFGPVLEPGHCYSFDFTLVFEESIFAIVPCAVVLPLTAARLWQLCNRPVTVYRPHKKWETTPAANWPLVLGLKLVGSLF